MIGSGARWRPFIPVRRRRDVFKVLAFLTKRDGMATGEFVDYYENHHVPLILELARAPLVYKRRYRGEALTRDGGGVDFDVVTELGFADRAAYIGWMAQLADAGGQVAADEARFLDQSRMRAFVVEEYETSD
jgi:EthD domain